MRTGLGLTFLGFGIIATEVVTGDVTLTVRIATALIVAGGLNEVIRYYRPGPAWPDESIRRVTMVGNLVALSVVAVNVFVGSVGFLMLLMLVVLSTPASVFIRAIADMERIGLKASTDAQDGT